MLPNTTRGLLEEFFGRRIVTRSQETMVSCVASPTPTLLVPFNPARIALLIGESDASFLGYFLAQNPDIIAGGGGYPIGSLNPQVFKLLDLYDDLTLPLYAAGAGATVDIYVREVILVGPLEP